MRFSLIAVLIGFTVISSCAEQADPETVAPQDASVTLFKNFNVISMDPAKAEMSSDTSVLVENDKIIAVGPLAQIQVPETATIVDGNGRTLLPGLVDMHVHIWDEAELSAYLSYGVTTVRNASGMPFHLEFQERIDSGALVGPRLFTTGPILNSAGPNAQVNHQIVETAEQARAAVRDHHKQGYKRLKVYSNLNREAYEAILDEAAKLNLTIMGHTPEGRRDAGIPLQKPFNISFEETLDDGFVTIEHMESIVWHGLRDELNIEKARQLAQTIAQSGNVVSPTLLAHRNLIEVANSDGEFLKRPGTELLNPFVSEIEQETYTFWSAQPQGARAAQDAFYSAATKVFHEEGVTLVAGTDAGVFTNIPGQSLHRELGFYVEAGLSPHEALVTATINPAKALGTQDSVGQIKTGFRADFIILDQNPLQDITALSSISGLMVNGQWFDQLALAALRDQGGKASYMGTLQRVVAGLAAQGSEL
jgi:imidazolonepropionase-like amidohydrolase